MIRSILVSDPNRFATLAIQTLADTGFVSTWQPFFQSKADPVQIKEKKELDFLVAHWLLRNAPKGSVSQKVLKRNMSGGVDETTKTKNYGDVYKAQTDFSNTFPITGWEAAGHYATTAGGLNYIYSQVSGKEGFKIKVTDFGKDYALAKSKAGSNGSINAAIKGHDFYQAGGKEVTKGPAQKHPAKYRHWVMIDDVQEEHHTNKLGGTDKFYKLKVWTYEKHFDALVREDVIGNYIPQLVVM
jgi:hypothetical protein